MNVIAKMYALAAPRAFPDAQQIDLTCVCDDRLMTVNQPVPGRVAENQTFNTASPSGDCRFNMSKDFEVHRSEEFYLIFTKRAECPVYDSAVMVSKVRCVSITDFGGTSKNVEVCSEYKQRDAVADHPQQSWTFNLRMMIDNAAASVQFEAGQSGYWVGIYRCNDFSMSDALGSVDA